MSHQADQSTSRTWAPINSSIIAQRTSNPIRKIVDQLNIPINAAKPRLQLSIGMYRTSYTTFKAVIALLIGILFSIKMCLFSKLFSMHYLALPSCYIIEIKYVHIRIEIAALKYKNLS